MSELVWEIVNDFEHVCKETHTVRLNDIEDICKETRTVRLKVKGGWIYKYDDASSSSVCFVTDVDLIRYQAHLRDAYKKGFEDGSQAQKKLPCEMVKMDLSQNKS